MATLPKKNWKKWRKFFTGCLPPQKKGVYWRIQEILYLKDTKIFQFDPLEAEKIESKDGNPT